MKKYALITGASSGIGLELAKIYARNGVNLVLVARRGEELRKLAGELTGIEVHVLAKDLARPSAPLEIVNELQAKGIVIDDLVNNAGFGDFGLFSESHWSRQQDMVQVNIMALTHLTHALLPGMVKRKVGRIMNVASTAAFQPGPLMSVYFATKAYVLHFSEALANELEGTGVTVTALCPGPTTSGFQQAANLKGSKITEKASATSRDVAEYGYKQMQAGKRVAIHGAVNSFIAQTVRFTPRAFVTNIVRKMQEKAQ